MICKKCGTEFLEGIYCPECGTKNEEIIVDEKAIAEAAERERKIAEEAAAEEAKKIVEVEKATIREKAEREERDRAIKIAQEEAKKSISSEDEDRSIADVEIVETAPHNYGHLGKYEGVGGHLFAVACQISMEAGCDGVVAFTSKTSLVEYYKQALNAVEIADRRLVIFEDAAEILLDKYIRK